MKFKVGDEIYCYSPNVNGQLHGIITHINDSGRATVVTTKENINPKENLHWRLGDTWSFETTEIGFMDFSENHYNKEKIKELLGVK